MPHRFILCVFTLFMLMFSGPTAHGADDAVSEDREPSQKYISRIYIRFSVVTGPNSCLLNITRTTKKGTFRTEREAYEAKVFDPDRLNMRFHLFEHITLPSLQALKVPEGLDFKAVLLTSENLPAPYKERLQGLIAGQDTLFEHIVCKYTDNFIGRANQALFRDIKAGGHTHVFSTRLDDDDAIAPSFLQSLVEDAPKVGWSGFISYPQGAFLHVDPEQGAQYGLGYRWPNIGAGITMVSPIQDDQPIRKANIFQHGNHLHIKSKLIERPLIFLRSGHSHNDQGDVSKKKELANFKTKTDRHLPYEWIQERFGTTLPKAEGYNGAVK